MTQDRARGDFRLTVALAQCCAEERQWAEGYTHLVRGFASARQLAAAGAAWAAELVVLYRRAVEEYEARHGVLPLREPSRQDEAAAVSHRRILPSRVEAAQQRSQELRSRAAVLLSRARDVQQNSVRLLAESDARRGDSLLQSSPRVRGCPSTG